MRSSYYSWYYRLSDRGLIRPLVMGAGALGLLGVVVAIAPPTYVMPAHMGPPVEVAPPAPQRFEQSENKMERACQIAVAVDDASGTPVRDAELTLYRAGRSGTLALWRAVTGAQASHTFVDVPPGTYHLNVTKAGAANVAAETLECAGDEMRSAVHVRLPRTRSTIQVALRGFGGGAPEGGEVLLEAESGQRKAFAGVLHLPLDAAGRATMPVPPGRYVALALAPHHVGARQSVNVPKSGRLDVAFDLSPRPEARGRVVDEAGEAVAFAEVFLGPLRDPNVPATSVTADSEGRFVLPLVPGQRHVVGAHKRGRFGHTALAPARDAIGHSDIEVVAPRGHRVTGFLQNERGVPLGFEHVQFRVRDFGIVGKARTDADGRFAIPGLPFTDVEVWPAEGATGAWAAQVATVQTPRVLLTAVTPAYEK